jgi:hypothetical protein
LFAERSAGAPQRPAGCQSRRFPFCLLAIDWGWSIEETCERLLEKSSKPRENGEGYARLTAQRAAAAVDRRPAKFKVGMGKDLWG